MAIKILLFGTVAHVSNKKNLKHFCTIFLPVLAVCVIVLLPYCKYRIRGHRNYSGALCIQNTSISVIVENLKFDNYNYNLFLKVL